MGQRSVDLAGVPQLGTPFPVVQVDSSNVISWSRYLLTKANTALSETFCFTKSSKPPFEMGHIHWFGRQY